MSAGRVSCLAASAFTCSSTSVVSYLPTVSRPLLGRPIGDRRLCRPHGFQRSEDARGADALDAGRRVRCSSARVREAARVDSRRTAAGHHQSSELLADLLWHEPLRREVGRPVVCTLQGEELFIEGLIEPYRTKALELIRCKVAHVDHFIRRQSTIVRGSCRITCAYPGVRSRSCRLGINMQGYERTNLRPPGAVHFASAILPASLRKRDCMFWRMPTFDFAAGRQRRARLEAAGYASPAHASYLDQREADPEASGTRRASSRITAWWIVNGKLAFLKKSRSALRSCDLRRTQRDVSARSHGLRSPGRPTAPWCLRRNRGEDRRRLAGSSG